MGGHPRPLEGLIRPSRGFVRPLKGLIRPFKGFIRPLKGLIKPFLYIMPFKVPQALDVHPWPVSYAAL